MRHGKAAALLTMLLGGLGLLGALYHEPDEAQQPDDDQLPAAVGTAEPVPFPQQGILLEVVLGLKDTAPTKWDGSITVSGGELVSLMSFPGKKQWQDGRWKQSTALKPGGPAKPKQAKKNDAPKKNQPAKKDDTAQKIQSGKKDESAKKPETQPIRLQIVLVGTTEMEVAVKTAQGDFSVSLAKLALTSSVPEMFLDGQASVRRLPLARTLTRAETDDDYPALAAAPDGKFWCAYLAYNRGTGVDRAETDAGRYESLIPRGNGDQVRLMSYDGKSWSVPLPVSATGLTAWRPAVAVDADGKVWTFWSQLDEGNWDLHARAFDPATGKFGPVRKLTTDPGADLNVTAVRIPQTAAGVDAGIWLAWQARREGQLDILLARLTADQTLQSQKVSPSSANDWHPALAATSSGQLWIGWDTYDQGHYDVFVRGLTKQGWSEPIAIGNSPRFEARPALATDARDRLWVAYEDAGPNWGKDFGQRLKGNGTPFYFERNILVRCLQDGQLLETLARPKSELIATHFDDPRFKNEPKLRISMPRLSCDGTGRLWLLYRRHPLATANGERWISLAQTYDGQSWSPEQVLPQSENLIDNRPSLAPLKDGGLLVAYSTDGRTAGSSTAGVCQIRASLLQPVSEAQELKLQPAQSAAWVGQDDPTHPDERAQVERMRNYRIELNGKTYRLLRGEFHRHTEYSAHRDWDGPLEEIWRYALDCAALDWIGPGDHDYAVGHDYAWWITQKQIELYNNPQFLAMFTYERSQTYPSGHRNVMFSKRGIRPLPALKGQELLFGTPEGGAPDIKNLYQYLKFFNGICSSHTSATSMGTDWRNFDPVAEPVVEIFQGHRQNYEETTAPLAAKNAADSIQGYQPAGFVWQAFAKGIKLGFQCSSDHVSTHISYAVVLAEEPTREGLVAAFRKRHSYAANDNILLDVRCGELLMGDEGTISQTPHLEISAIGTKAIARVDIVRQVGQAMPAYVYHSEPNSEKLEFKWFDQEAQPGLNMYYVRIQQIDNRLAWASPIWLHYQPKQKN